MLRIVRSLYQVMLDHAQLLYPHEACGLLAGRNGLARHLYLIENRLHSPVAYEMDPGQQVRAMLEIEQFGWEWLALYHSHPGGPAHPSPTDIAQAYYPEAIQIIVSLADRDQPRVRGFTIIDGRIDEIHLIIE